MRTMWKTVKAVKDPILWVLLLLVAASLPYSLSQMNAKKWGRSGKRTQRKMEEGKKMDMDEDTEKHREREEEGPWKERREAGGTMEFHRVIPRLEVASLLFSLSRWNAKQCERIGRNGKKELEEGINKQLARSVDEDTVQQSTGKCRQREEDHGKERRKEEAEAESEEDDLLRWSRSSPFFPLCSSSLVYPSSSTFPSPPFSSFLDSVDHPALSLRLLLFRYLSMVLFSVFLSFSVSLILSVCRLFRYFSGVLSRLSASSSLATMGARQLWEHTMTATETALNEACLDGDMERAENQREAEGKQWRRPSCLSFATVPCSFPFLFSFFFLFCLFACFFLPFPSRFFVVSNCFFWWLLLFFFSLSFLLSFHFIFFLSFLFLFFLSLGRFKDRVRFAIRRLRRQQQTVSFTVSFLLAAFGDCFPLLLFSFFLFTFPLFSFFPFLFFSFSLSRLLPDRIRSCPARHSSFAPSAADRVAKTDDARGLSAKMQIRRKLSRHGRQTETTTAAATTRSRSQESHCYILIPLFLLAFPSNASNWFGCCSATTTRSATSWSRERRTERGTKKIFPGRHRLSRDGGGWWQWFWSSAPSAALLHVVFHLLPHRFFVFRIRILFLITTNSCILISRFSF